MMVSDTTAKSSAKKITKQELKSKLITFPLHVLVSPFKGFDELKTQNRGSMLFAVVVMILLGAAHIYSSVGLSFVYRGWSLDVPTVNMFGLIMFTYSPILLICVSNWLVTAITNGNGKLKEIFLVYCHAAVISIFCITLATFLSNFVTLDEVAFLRMIFGFGQVTLYFYLFMGLLVIHEYSLLRGIVMVILTVLAMLIIVFILTLFFSLVSELIFFIILIVQETEAFLL